MADWPELDELKQVLNADPELEVWDGDEDGTRLTRLLSSAIAFVKADVGVWTDDGEPNDSLASAALRLAELCALKPEVAAAVAGTGRGLAAVISDPTYEAFMFGQRRAWGIG